MFHDPSFDHAASAADPVGRSRRHHHAGRAHGRDHDERLEHLRQRGPGGRGPGAPGFPDGADASGFPGAPGWGGSAFGPGRAILRGALFGGSRARRGDIRSAILQLLADEPMHGYQIIGELERRSGGRWRPSAGSVYPTLQQLEDEGLVQAVDQDGRHVYELTDAGRAAAAETAERSRRGAPWGRDGHADAAELRHQLAQVASATVQVAQVGNPALTAQAQKLLTETRRSLYRLLAEDEGPSSAAEPAQQASSAGPEEPSEEPRGT